MSPEQRSCPAYPLFPSPAFALLRALIQCLWVAEVYALIYAHKPAAIRWHTICSGLVLVSGGANQPSMGQANWNRVWECSRLNICMCGYDSGYGWGWGCCGGCQEQAAPAEGHLHLTLASKLPAWLPAWHAVAFVFVPHALKKLPQGTHDDPSAKDPLHPPLFVPSFA